MKAENRTGRPGHLLLSLSLLLLCGCAGLDRPEAEPSSRVVHITRTSHAPVCGELFQFVSDIHRLDRKQQADLLKESADETSPRYFCDQLKTGILLSQIGRTIKEDDQAISLLTKYVNSNQISDDERWLLELLANQSRERRRLHVLLNEFGNKLVDQESLSRNLSSDLLNLRQQLDQLQKIEADINATQQSISTPAAPVDQQTTPDTDS